MSPQTELIVAVVVAVLGSSGLWALVLRLIERKNDNTKLLLGLAHDRIMQEGAKYLEQGFVTNDQYDNLYCLYVPYKRKGGNGTATRMMTEIEKLPIKPDAYAYDSDEHPAKT